MEISFLFEVSFFIGMAMNVLEMVYLIRGKRLKEPFNMVVFSLAAADLLSLIGASVIGVAWIANKVYLAHIMNLVVLCVTASQLHIIIITCQRFMVVLFPFKSKTLMTARRFTICLATVWLLSALLTAVLFLFKSKLNITIAMSLMLLCGGVLLLSYSIIVYHLVKARGKITSAKVASSQNTHVVIYSICVTLAFISCNYPLAIQAMTSKRPKPNSPSNTPESFAFWLNPMIDPVIYFLFQAYRHGKIKCCCRRFTFSAKECQNPTTINNTEDAIQPGAINHLPATDQGGIPTAPNTSECAIQLGTINPIATYQGDISTTSKTAEGVIRPGAINHLSATDQDEIPTAPNTSECAIQLGTINPIATYQGDTSITSNTADCAIKLGPTNQSV